MKRPFQERSKISDEPVEITDITPTIADVLDIPYEWAEVDGRSMFHRKGVAGKQRSVNGISISPTGRELYDAARLKYKMFARDGNGIDPYRVGSAEKRKLVGASVTDFETLGSAAEVDVANLAMIERGSDGPMLPNLLQGTIEGPPQEEALIAVAIDGRLAAFTPTYVEDGRTRFYCMLPPRLLGEAPNEVQVFWADGYKLVALRAA